MSVSIQTVEFERRQAYLSELEDGPPFTVHGVALGNNDVTVGQSGIKKLWPASALKESADTLEGRSLVVDHNNDSSGVVGEVTKAGYKDTVGVIYEAELFDEELAEKINNGLLEVSIRGKHIDVEQMEETEEGAKVVEDILFDNLSIVPTGAAPSNSIEMGEAEELSMAELSALADSLESSDELQEIEPGMWVKGDDMKGITVSAVEDGEIEVDIYEESDGKWRSTGETKMVSTSSLDEWDVDEEEDIGAQKDEDTEVNEELAAQGDKVQWGDDDSMSRGVVVDRQTSGCFEERIDGDTKVCAEEGDPALLINIVQGSSGNFSKTGQMVSHKESTVEQTDFSLAEVDPPEFNEGMMVQWAVNPNMFGKVVHNPDDEEIIMVEVMERMDGEMKPTGHTLTAAPPDLEPMDEEEMTSVENLEQFSDYPEAAKENAQMALDAREETGNPNDCGTQVGWTRANQLASGEAVSEEVVAKMASFNRHRQNSEMGDDEGKSDCGWMMWKAWGGDEGVDWAMNKMEQIEEASDRVEGEEEKGNLDNIQKQSPERFPEGEDKEELQSLEVHSVEFSGTTTSDWSKPSMEDFDTSNLEEIDNHFIVSKSGFPPENFTDLALPVVEPNGELNLNALQNAKARGNQVEGLSGDDLDNAMTKITNLANENFEDANFGDEEEARMNRKRTVDDTGAEPNVQNDGPVEIALDLINKYLTIEGNHERDTVDNMLSWLMGSVDLPIETVGDFRTAARRFLDETPGTDSFHGLTVEQFRDWLLMHGHGSKGRREQETQQRGELPPGEPTSVNVLTGDDLRQKRKSEESELDDVTTKVINMTEEIEQKLAELSEPVAVEQSDLEELEEKADRFEEMSSTLESLKERTDILDSVDRSQVEELADSDDPMVVESARYESLSDEAEQVKGVYAAALAEEMPAFSADELADKFSIENLREKYEEQIGDLEDELSAEPRSGDVDEEELEERAGSEEEELEPSETDEAEQKREELREQILS